MLSDLHKIKYQFFENLQEYEEIALVTLCKKFHSICLKVFAETLLSLLWVYLPAMRKYELLDSKIIQQNQDQNNQNDFCYDNTCILTIR